jgi:preprotein translocase subunit YajC
VAFIIVLAVMLVFMYFLLIRPQQQQKRRTQDMLDRLQPGDEVITIGGIYGDVVEVHDEKVVLEIAEDIHIEVTRRAVANIVPPESETADVEEEEEELEEAEEPAAETEGEELEAAEESTEVEERTR